MAKLALVDEEVFTAQTEAAVAAKLAAQAWLSLQDAQAQLALAQAAAKQALTEVDAIERQAIADATAAATAASKDALTAQRAAAAAANAAKNAWVAVRQAIRELKQAAKAHKSGKILTQLRKDVQQTTKAARATFASATFAANCAAKAAGDAFAARLCQLAAEFEDLEPEDDKVVQG